MTVTKEMRGLTTKELVGTTDLLAGNDQTRLDWANND